MGGSVVSGLLVGGAGAVVQRMDSQDRDIRDSERAAEKAVDKVNKLAANGALRRLMTWAASDLLLGVSYPSQSSQPGPSDFAAAPAPIPRPILADEDAVLDASGWPAPANQYNSEGKIIDPTRVMDGVYFPVGLALGYAELQAALRGMTSATQPTDEDIKQVFRHQQGLIQALGQVRSENGDEAQLQSFFTGAWQRFFQLPVVPAESGYPAGLIYALEADSTAVDATSLTTSLSIDFLANLLAVGDVARLRFSSVPMTVTATPNLTTTVTLGGNTIASATVASPANGARQFVEIDITRRPDAGGLAVFAIGSDLAQDNDEQVPATAGLISMNHGVTQPLVIAYQWSGGSCSIAVRTATLEKLKKVV